jgi:DNA polymerase I
LITYEREWERCLVQTEDEFNSCFSFLFSKSLIAIDVETQGLDVNHYIIGIGLASFPRSFYIPIRHIATAPITPSLFDPIPNPVNIPSNVAIHFLKELIKTKTFIYHNSSFDITKFILDGIDPYSWKFEDTYILAHLIDERLSQVRKGLSIEGLTEVYFNYKPTEEEECKNWAFQNGKKTKWKEWMVNIPLTLLYNYGCADVEQTYDLFSHKKFQEIKSEFEVVYKREIGLIPLVAKMNLTGLPINRKHLMDHRQRIRSEIESIEKEGNLIADRNINLGSSVQIAEYLRSKGYLIGFTQKGQVAVDDDALLQIDDSLCPIIRRYRSLNKTDGTYIENFLNKYSFKNYLFANWRSLGPRTGRFSSKIGQIIPKRDPEKKEVCRGSIYNDNEEEYTWVAIDFSQLQLRIAAHLSKDSTMNKVYLSNGDIHTTTAQYVFNTDEISKRERTLAKCLNFSVLFGAGPDNIIMQLRAEGILLSYEEAVSICKRFYSLYTGVQKYARKLRDSMASKDFIINMFGRRRWLVGYEKKKVLNAVIQSTEADLVKEVLNRLKNLYYGRKTHLLAQIHDEMIIAFANDEFDELFWATVDAMQSWEGIFSIPIRVGVCYFDGSLSKEVETSVDALLRATRKAAKARFRKQWGLPRISPELCIRNDSEWRKLDITLTRMQTSQYLLRYWMTTLKMWYTEGCKEMNGNS